MAQASVATTDICSFVPVDIWSMETVTPSIVLEATVKSDELIVKWMVGPKSNHPGRFTWSVFGRARFALAVSRRRSNVSRSNCAARAAARALHIHGSWRRLQFTASARTGFSCGEKVMHSSPTFD